MRRRAAAKGQLLERLRARVVRLHEVCFAPECFDVFGALAVVARHDLVAAAVVADIVAERHVHVERELRGLLFVSAAGERLFVVGNAEARMKAVGRRIGRVAGRRHVEFAEQIHFRQLDAARFGRCHVWGLYDLS